MQKTGKWFVAERSEAIAGLFLTSHKELEVLNDVREDNGADFLVKIRRGDPSVLKLFAVQVKGSERKIDEEFRESLRPQLKRKALFMPACLFLVDVRSNQMWYGWLAEPILEANGAKLEMSSKPDVHPLTTDSIDEIVDRVSAWYDHHAHADVSKQSSDK